MFTLHDNENEHELKTWSHGRVQGHLHGHEHGHGQGRRVWNGHKAWTGWLDIST
jgi:hypothetical protein